MFMTKMQRANRHVAAVAVGIFLFSVLSQPAFAQDATVQTAPASTSEQPAPDDTAGVAAATAAAESKPDAAVTDGEANAPEAETPKDDTKVEEPNASAPLVAGGAGAGAGSDWESLAAVQLLNPQDFGSGAFQQRIAIAVPPFRGFEPKISLNYQSGQPLQYSGNGAGWMGIGWRIDGIPSVERGLRGGGTPNFDSNDVFTLAGEELVSCTPAMVSPSCATGGTHATRDESYRHISYSSVTNYWTVTDRDGTVYEFRPTIETQPVNPSDPIAVSLANQYRWLLRTVTDTHSNQVTYSYVCSAAVYCLVDTITYGGALVTFYWETRPDPYTYATGLNTINVTDRLRR
jgi:hypothetical protein